MQASTRAELSSNASPAASPSATVTTKLPAEIGPAVPATEPAFPSPAPTALSTIVAPSDPAALPVGPPLGPTSTPRPTDASVPNIVPSAAPSGLRAVAGAPLNASILDLVRNYPLGEANPYDWKRGMNTDGVSRDLLWRGVPLALAGGDSGVHCSGITWEVYIQALQQAVGTAGGPSPEELLAVKETWYIRTKDETGPVGALAGHGLGEAVPDAASLRPGDLVQFWRNSGKGHSAVFIEHRRNRDGSIRGLVYWSAQGSSGGIGRRIVSFGEDVNQVVRLYAVRATLPTAASTSPTPSTAAAPAPSPVRPPVAPPAG